MIALLVGWSWIEISMLLRTYSKELRRGTAEVTLAEMAAMSSRKQEAHTNYGWELSLTYAQIK